jgi:hypothetical protein
MVANHIDEGSKALRLAQATVLAQDREDPGEGLLADVLDGMRGVKPGAKLELEELRKIGNEVLLRLGVTSAEITDVTRIE